MSLSIDNSIQEFKRRYAISDSCMLIVGVSGGIDSMVLLHALKSVHDLITVAHINYKLRAEDSNEDALLVERISKTYDLPFKILENDLKADLEKNGGNLQEKARIIRYAFFNSLKQEYSDSKIVLAHHQNDQIENFWMQMARGGGIGAMSGMKIINEEIFRPLLLNSKAQIHEYANKYKIEWRKDCSNDVNSYTRNIWRNVLIPELKKSTPHLDQSVIKIQEVFKQKVKLDQQFIESLNLNNGKSFMLEFKKMKTFDSNQWIEFLKHLKIPLSLGLSIASLPFLPNGKKILMKESQSEYVSIWKEDTGLYFQSKNEIQISVPKMSCTEVNSLPQIFNKKEYYIDKALLRGKPTIRKWQKGDRMYPIGVNGSKLVSDILKDAKTPLRLKANQYVLVDDEKVLALVGHCVDRGAISTKGPCLKIEITT